MLPSLLPMLAIKAEPFDSSEYSFEIKWDGVRALAAVEDGTVRLWGREKADYTGRYPELELLKGLPSGTLVDGELISLVQGRPDLPALLRRHHLSSSQKIAQAARQSPVQYILFDLLYFKGRPLTEQPLLDRREILGDLVRKLNRPAVQFSTGVIGSGKDCFQQAVAHGPEGVVAKHCTSRYRPGQRSPAWRKIKPPRWLPGVIIGYRLDRNESLHSVLVATAVQGKLQYTAELSQGIRASERGRLRNLLQSCLRPCAAVPCLENAHWVEPEVYCRVWGGRWTPAGHLQGATYGGQLDG